MTEPTPDPEEATHPAYPRYTDEEADEGAATEVFATHRDQPRIGRFALLRKLGEGGMGVVYLAYDETLDRRVAVKVLQKGAAGDAWLVREAQALAKLSNPHVVPIYDAGHHEGRVFLAMEFVPGRTLTSYIEDEGPAVQEVLRVYIEAGKGLIAAHKAGLVHRDFKPDNVLVGHDGRARVVDFGIAGLAESHQLSPVGHPTADPSRPASAGKNALAFSLTKPGALVGTPGYVSPEQFLGERATPLSDQFAFSVALYEGVYHQVPFDARHYMELFRKVTTEPPRLPPPNHKAPEWLWPILQRGMAKNPAERFPNLAAMLEEIEHHLKPAHDGDPQATRREQILLFGVLILYAVGVTTYIGIRGEESAVKNPWDLVVLAFIFLFVCTLGVTLTWKALQRSAFGRRFTAVLLGTPVLLLAHRLVAAGLGLPTDAIVVEDLLLLTAMFTIFAMAVDKRLFWVPILGLGVLAACTLYPEYGRAGFMVVAICGLASGIVFWGRAKPTQPGS
ncbi:MAG: serine/threonine protein kinase [Polyangiaceae bacterium]|nr:serine/threonine protein kinase [Polyangiaceae bacterium]